MANATDYRMAVRAWVLDADLDSLIDERVYGDPPGFLFASGAENGVSFRVLAEGGPVGLGAETERLTVEFSSWARGPSEAVALSTALDNAIDGAADVDVSWEGGACTVLSSRRTRPIGSPGVVGRDARWWRSVSRYRVVLENG
jgi:hypothetical protein